MIRRARPRVSRPLASCAILLTLGLTGVLAQAPAALPNQAAQTPEVRSHAFRRSGKARATYLATAKGLLALSDGAGSWTPVPIEGTNAEVFDVAVHPAGRLIAARRDGLWESETAARHWKRLASPVLEPWVPVAIGLSESRPENLFVVTARHGVFRSVNGGRAWREANQGLPLRRPGGGVVQLRAIVVDPRNSDVAFAAHEAFGVYRTLDGGERWTRAARGLPIPGARMSAVYTPLLVYGPGDVLFLVFSQPVHSHLVRTSLYRREGDAWVPIEIELPSNQPVVGATFDSAARALTLWTDQSSFIVAAKELGR